MIQINVNIIFFFNAVHFQTMIFNGISILWKVVKLWNSCNFTFFFVLVEYCTLRSWALFGTLSITCINMKTNIYTVLTMWLKCPKSTKVQLLNQYNIFLDFGQPWILIVCSSSSIFSLNSSTLSNNNQEIQIWAFLDKVESTFRSMRC